MAIVDDTGRVLFAEATERYLQSKRAVNVAPDLLHRTSQLLEEFCEPDAMLVAAFSWSEHRKARHEALLLTLDETQSRLDSRFRNLPRHLRRELLEGRYLLKSNLGMQLLSGEALEVEINRNPRLAGSRLERRRFDHHLSHAAAACFSSPFETAVCGIFDGYGEESSYAFFKYDRDKLELLSTLRRRAEQARVSDNFMSAYVKPADSTV